MTELHTPGTIVRARGREWVVLHGSTSDVLHLRPLTGSEADPAFVCPAIEPVEPASFRWPDPQDLGNQESALLLRDALLLSLRRGAGPFRSFGHLAIEPRPYQLVPLLMALKLNPVRLLIADDVGIGKTIEALLILRELMDRGEVERSVVLCPPHLINQWVMEMKDRFGIQAQPLTAREAKDVERQLSSTETFFSRFPHTVISLDYIKSEARRDYFCTHCPNFVIVDEAHTCTAGSVQNVHLRRELLLRLAKAEPPRHLLLLTATPHSGDEDAFYELLSCLDFEFIKLKEPDLEEKERKKLRDRLALHFVMRKRHDIKDWQRQPFPERIREDLPYELSARWHKLLNALLDHCAEVIQTSEGELLKRRSFWGTLALLRCASSSPKAILSALRNRASPTTEFSPEKICDEDSEGFLQESEDDFAPPNPIGDPTFSKILKLAQDLLKEGKDPKLEQTIQYIEKLLEENHRPIVFCRFIATAHYVKEAISSHFAQKNLEVAVEAVTSEIPHEDRLEKVIGLVQTSHPYILVATDCLSEGINLQEHFDAVIHYDLSWNPTRHEQREGRVDRFGQKRPKVRAALLYGRNNPVDGIVLEVILRKAMRIQKELGVHVPVPDSMPNVAEALFRAFLMRHQQGGSSRGLYSYPQLELFSERKWQKAVEKNKQIRTRFAQSSIDPNEAINEWKKATSLIGGEESVKRFVTRALSRFGVEVRGREDSSSFSINLAQLRSASLKERLAMEMEIPPSETLKVSFSYPPPPFHESIQRNHPMASVLAEALLSATLSHDPANPHLIDPTEKMAILGRVGAWVVEGIPKRTIVTLLRLRHRIGTESHIGFVEEATALAWSGSFEATPIEGEEALRLLDLPSVANPPPHVRNRLKELLEELRNTHQHQLEAFAKKRAQELRQDHERIRVKPTHSKIKVEPLLPPDLVGFYLLLPRQ